MSTMTGERTQQEVVSWRRAQLRRAGFRPSVAARLAGDPRYDLHALLELVDRGCPPALAVRILAPLADEGGEERRMRASTLADTNLVPPDADTAAASSDAPRTLDPESQGWLDDLRAEGAARDEAIGRLHALLLRAATFEVGRRRASLPHLRGGELDDIAMEAADDALLSVLRRLDDFRGRSRFTTWVYKFALFEAAVKLRKRAWQGREIPPEPEAWNVFADARLGPDEELELGELLRAVERAIAGELTPHQRTVLVALAIDGVPIDVLADRLGSNRGALYKTLHDARRKLRAHLAEQGLGLEPEKES